MSRVLFSMIKAKKSLLALTGALVVSSSSIIAAVPIDGWYSSVFGGYTYVPDNIYFIYNNGLRHRSAYRSGYNAGLRIGFQGMPLRYEGELTYIDAKLKGFYVNAINQRGISGETQGSFATANVYYDFPEMLPAIQPFAGLGLGYGWVKGRFNSVGPFFPTFYKGSNSAFAYQGTVGLTFNYAENFALNIAYRYIGTTKIDSLGKVFQANLASVGVIYRFNEYLYK